MDVYEESLRLHAALRGLSPYRVQPFAAQKTVNGFEPQRFVVKVHHFREHVSVTLRRVFQPAFAGRGHGVVSVAHGE